jgi:hypothetical protein
MITALCRFKLIIGAHRVPSPPVQAGSDRPAGVQFLGHDEQFVVYLMALVGTEISYTFPPRVRL